ncbi:MAG: T9SS type A sorting domain-containing protein [Crocinitomicaceae bacterium]|nr:T9SS type A sorting domain-containing protein [Crocinitomicaceae bacterium]
MKTLINFTLLSFLLLLYTDGKSQCNTATSICNQGVVGPFTFSTPGPSVSTCLDFYGPGYAYVVLYITQSGPLEMLINGSASSGFLDVAIFLIPPGQDPCVAIQNSANQISCNYASSASGCNQIGTYFSCPSSVSSPMVSAGDKLMIVVENWSGSSSNFTLQLAPSPAAQSGPGNATVNPPSSTVYTSTPSFQMTAVDNGGVWSGVGITPGGIFDPSISGAGTFTLTYSLGTPPCDAVSTYQITVNLNLAVEINTIDLFCEGDKVKLLWETESQSNCDYFTFERSRDGFDFQIVDVIDGAGTTNELLQYISSVDYDFEYKYYRLVEVDYNGEKTIYGPFNGDCSIDDFLIYPNPTSAIINIQLVGFHLNKTNMKVIDAFGKIIIRQKAMINSEQHLSLKGLSAGIYTLVIEDEYHREISKIVKL